MQQGFVFENPNSQEVLRLRHVVLQRDPEYASSTQSRAMRAMEPISVGRQCACSAKPGRNLSAKRRMLNVPDGRQQHERPDRAGNAAAGTCWSCGAMRAAHFCSECGKVQPPGPVDYFSFFGLPRKLNVDTGSWSASFTS